ncbi:hypothetical protein KAF25_009119 [Fusarium avenaceum]|uniref:Ubiquitin-like protease family profile domain-containing protein n=1 Tax=Fusarium avenaceum TaxID=40199 RepID=A0A9P7KNI3_9HYPO|nr:hypothetical protein KAF25_009119 [Fusarium avenaceum]
MDPPATPDPPFDLPLPVPPSPNPPRFQAEPPQDTPTPLNQDPLAPGFVPAAISDKAFYYNTIQDMTEAGPSSGAPLRRQLNESLSSYPAAVRPTVIRQVVELAPLMKETAKEARRLQKQGNISWPDKNTRRTTAALAELDRLWGGRNWLPAGWRKGSSDVDITYDNIKQSDLWNLKSICQLASAVNFPLSALYRIGGPLHDASIQLNQERWPEATAAPAQDDAAGHDPIAGDNESLGGDLGGNFGDANWGSPEGDSELDLPEMPRAAFEVMGPQNEDISSDHEEQPVEARAGKRKLVDSSSPIDISSPDRHPSLFPDVNFRALAHQHLTNNEWLSGDDIDTLQRLIFERVQSDGYHIEDFVRVHPVLTFPITKLAIPRKVRVEPSGKVLLVVLHHTDPGHWTVVRVDVNRQQVLWYNPLNNWPAHCIEAKQICAWLDEHNPFKFFTAHGPTQPDTHSCGPFVLNAVRVWLQGQSLPLSEFDNPLEFLLSLVAPREATPLAQLELHLSAPLSEVKRPRTLSPPAHFPLLTIPAAIGATTAVEQCQSFIDQVQALTSAVRANVGAVPRESLAVLRLEQRRLDDLHDTISQDLRDANLRLIDARRNAAARDFVAPLMENNAGDHPDLPAPDAQLQAFVASMQAAAVANLAKLPIPAEGESVDELVERRDRLVSLQDKAAAEIKQHAEKEQLELKRLEFDQTLVTLMNAAYGN